MGKTVSDSEGVGGVNAREYLGVVQNTIQAAPHVISFEIAFEEIDYRECYIRGKLQLTGDLQLHIAEYVITGPTLDRTKYRYHLQDADGRMLARWDNAPHHREVATFPHHRHEADGTVKNSPAMDIEAVLQAVVAFL